MVYIQFHLSFIIYFHIYIYIYSPRVDAAVGVDKDYHADGLSSDDDSGGEGEDDFFDNMDDRTMDIKVR